MVPIARDVMRAVIPPFIASAARRLRQQKHVYASWDQAARAAGSYDDALMNKFRAARALLNVERDLRQDILSTPLSWLTEMMAGEISIADFGGALGEYGFALCAQRPRVRYTVVENPTLVALAGQMGQVSFKGELPPSCDIFFSSSTLQYVAKPYDNLERGFAIAKVALVLVRNNFCEREIFRVQKSRLFDNGHGAIPPGFRNSLISYPLRTISERRIQSIAARSGFKLISRTSEQVETYGDSDVYGAQLTYLRC